jgi:hypothetical protein
MTVKPKERGSVITCACCGLPNEIYLDSPSAQRVCDRCKMHNTGDWHPVAELHTAWVVDYRLEQDKMRLEELDQHRRTSYAKDVEIKALSLRTEEAAAVIANDYVSSPVGHLQDWLRSEVVQKADRRVSAAYRARDSAMAVLWRLDQMHKQRPDGKTCTCGKPTTACREFKALDEFAASLDKWEDREIARLKKNMSTGLPPEHPELKKRPAFGYLRVNR